MSASIPLAFGRLLAATRQDAKLSQRAVARAMGTTQSAVSEMESGLVVPTIETAIRYFVAVGYASCDREPSPSPSESTP